jgi:hypothetical protein
VPAPWAHPQRPIVPVPPPAVACTSIRVPLSWSPSSTVPPHIDTHERSPSTSSTTTLTVHSRHASAIRVAGSLTRPPLTCQWWARTMLTASLGARFKRIAPYRSTVCSTVRTLLCPPRCQRAVGWHRICSSMQGEACAHNTPHSATSGGAVRVWDYHPGRGQDATHLVACCGERPQRRRCGVDCLGGMHHDGV